MNCSLLSFTQWHLFANAFMISRSLFSFEFEHHNDFHCFVIETHSFFTSAIFKRCINLRWNINFCSANSLHESHWKSFSLVRFYYYFQTKVLRSRNQSIDQLTNALKFLSIFAKNQCAFFIILLLFIYSRVNALIDDLKHFFIAAF